MFNVNLLMATIILALTVTGCASGSKRESASNSTIVAQQVVVTPTYQITSVAMSASAEVNDKQSELKERGFSTDALLDQVKKQLTDKKLIEGTSKSGLVLEIYLDGVRFRTTAGAIWAGFMAGADYIKATVYVKDQKIGRAHV